MKLKREDAMREIGKTVRMVLLGIFACGILFNCRVPEREEPPTIICKAGRLDHYEIKTKIFTADEMWLFFTDGTYYVIKKSNWADEMNLPLTKNDSLEITGIWECCCSDINIIENK